MSEIVGNNTKRVRQLTIKAMAIYEEKVVHFHRQLKRSWDIVELIIQKEVSPANEEIKQLELEVLRQFTKVDEIATNFNTYLLDIRTEDSHVEASKLSSTVARYRQSMNDYINKLHSLKQGNLEMNTIRSTTSSTRASSLNSKTNSALLVSKQAQAQAARTMVAFAEQEAELLREKAELMERESHCIQTKS